MNTKYRFTQKIWLYSADKSSWHFVTIPKDIASDIDDESRRLFGMKRAGFGSIPVQVQIGSSTWHTSIFPDKRIGSYILPIKAQIRKIENIYNKDSIYVTLEINSYRSKQNSINQ